ncbi:MAG: aminotransferase class I/II, partial [Candidatus Marinimicrobia bacterium]|nr:aminotransferase class I/II [Candidatus Neomarinimicrobiota bacterium]
MSQKNTYNRNLIDLEYAVRGPLAKRAEELAQQGRDIIPCNLGNPQAIGQKPITFYRQVLSLMEYPDSIATERSRGDFISKDVLDYAEEFLSCGKGLGAYTDSKGPFFIREAIARFIDERD